MIDFQRLSEEGKTVIYDETPSKAEIPNTNFKWEYWSNRKTSETEVSVWRAIVTLEEAEQYDLENNLFN